MFEKKIPPARFERLMTDPRLRSRLLVLNIITVAFFSAPVAYAGLIASGVLSGEGGAVSEFPIWWVLAAIAVMQVPALFIGGFAILRQAEREDTFGKAFERGQMALVLALALGESVCIFGVVASALGSPAGVAYGFLLFGVVLMGVSLIVFRPKAIAIAVLKLLEEEKASG